MTSDNRNGIPKQGGEVIQWSTVVHGKVEQIVIAQVLSDMDSEIAALEKMLEKYKMLKQGMMQNLLTGKIRLV